MSVTTRWGRQRLRCEDYTSWPEVFCVSLFVVTWVKRTLSVIYFMWVLHKQINWCCCRDEIWDLILLLYLNGANFLADFQLIKSLKPTACRDVEVFGGFSLFPPNAAGHLNLQWTEDPAACSSCREQLLPPAGWQQYCTSVQLQHHAAQPHIIN